MNKRMLLPDMLRTVAVIMMAVYHIAFNLMFLWHWDINVLTEWWWVFARTTAILFLVTVGITAWMNDQRHKSSKRIWKRIGWITLAALAITVATWFAMPEYYIRFGILHCIVGSLIILRIIRRMPQLIIAEIGVLSIGIGIPLLLKQVHTSLLIPFGIVPIGFNTLDYFPLLPWAGVVLIGYAIAPIALRLIDRTYQAQGMFGTMLLPGRHALTFYLLHQPILIGVMTLLLGMPTL